MAYEISFARSAVAEIDEIRAYDRKRIIAQIEKQLSDQPESKSKNRKCLVSIAPKFEHEAPVWELRVGNYRVFYDVDSERGVVTIRAVRRKSPENTTEDIIQ